MKNIFLTDEFIKTCQIDDPNFEACSRESIQILFKKLVTGKIHWKFDRKNHFISSTIKKGIDGFDGIQTIDPMKLNRIKIFQGDGPVSINSSISKAVVTGFANTEVVVSKYEDCQLRSAFAYLNNNLLNWIHF